MSGSEGGARSSQSVRQGGEEDCRRAPAVAVGLPGVPWCKHSLSNTNLVATPGGCPCPAGLALGEETWVIFDLEAPLD